MLPFSPSDIIIESEDKTENFGRFIVHPLSPGYGHTLGNALRRVLLSSLPGAALVQVQIEGVEHEFSTIKGVREDVTDILLNLKGVRLRLEGDEAVALRLEKKGKGEVLAGNISKVAGVEIANPDKLIATITEARTSLVMDFIVERGVGYLSSESRGADKVGVMSLDAVFSPVLRLNYSVEPTRVGQITDLDKLILEITTDGTITPEEALKQAAGTLMDYFFRLTKKEEEVKKVKEEKKRAAEEEKLRQEVTSLPVEELELPTRLTNSLIKGKVKTIGDLLSRGSSELAGIKNVGEKSVKKIQTALARKGWDALGD